jgi:probable HAF family extracellular repeat protein
VAATGLNNNGQVVGFMSSINPPFFDGDGFITGPSEIGVRLLVAPSLRDVVLPSGINDAGQVTGIFGHGLFSSGFLSEPNGGALHPIGGLGPFGSNPLAVNNRRQVTGTALVRFSHPIQEAHAFLTSGNHGALKDLGTLGGTLSVGNDVNDKGQVAGFSFLKGDVFGRAFLSVPSFSNRLPVISQQRFSDESQLRASEKLSL